jgi:hypothetical protein
MDEQVGAQQEAGDVVAPLENVHPLFQPQFPGLGQERPGVVLADGDQAGALPERPGQGGQGAQAAVQALGLEAGADLQQQQVALAQAELPAEGGADLGRVGRGPPVPGDTRGQQVETVFRGAVVLHEQGLLLAEISNIRVRPSAANTARSKAAKWR